MIFSKDEKFEEALYEEIAKEIANGNINQGLWLKATVESGGNEFKAKANYTKLRIKQFKREIEEDRENQIKRQTERTAYLKLQGLVICNACKCKVVSTTKENKSLMGFIFLVLCSVLIVPGIIYLMYLIDFKRSSRTGKF